MRALMVFSRRASGKCRLPRQFSRMCLPATSALRDALLGRAARAHVAGGQVEHAGAVARLRHADQRAAAGLLDIVGMRRDRENVEAHARAASLFRNSFISTLYLKAFAPIDRDHRHFVIVESQQLGVGDRYRSSS